MEKIIDYRKKHKKCKWCKYEKFIAGKYWIPIPSYSECVLKDIILHGNWRALFCKYYTLKKFD